MVLDGRYKCPWCACIFRDQDVLQQVLSVLARP